MCLYIPFLSTDRLRNVRSLAGARRHARASLGHDTQASAECTPVATISPHANALKIVHVDRAAYRLRIRPGQTLADAKAIEPNLVTYTDDPAADRRQLETLAIWGDCLSPVVHIEGDDTLIFDASGCERLFDGEEKLLARAIEGLDGQGFSARGAVADTPGAAWALARAHSQPAVVSKPGQTAADLAPLAVWSLRIDANTTAALASVGVETVASLFHLPRSSLARRFGDGPIDRMDQALGGLPEVLVPYRPQPVQISRIHFGAATTRIDVLQEAVQRALKRFCAELMRQVAGVRQMFVTFYCPNVETEEGARTRTVTLPVNLSQPTRSMKHLDSLLAVLLDNLRLPAPADSLALWARQLDPLDDWQDELFTTDASDVRELGDFLDRLAVRLGPQAVVRPKLCSEHQPERTFRYAPLAGSDGDLQPQAVCRQSSIDNRQSAIAVLPGPRPLRLSKRPIEVAATAIVPEGPPITFRLQGTQHVVTRSVGPERIETGWWRGSHLRRDYYRVTTRDGRRFWLFRERDTGKWFLHGWFD